MTSKRVMSHITNFRANILRWLRSFFDATQKLLVLAADTIDSLSRLSHLLSSAADASIG